MIALTNGHQWKGAQWSILTALILATLTGGIAMWRQFTLMEERMQFLLKLNDSQSHIIETLKDTSKATQQQTALLGHEDMVIQGKLREHEEFIREILGRLRKVEQGTP